MRKAYSILVGLTATLGTVAVMSTASAFAAAGHTAQSTVTSALAHPTRMAAKAQPDSPINCPPGDFCSYNTIEGSNPCVEQMTGNHNWNSPCVNNDVSILNGTTDKVRLYYKRSGWSAGGAFMCIDSGDHINNLLTGDHNPHNSNGAYVFDQGSDPGLFKLVYHDVAADSIVQGSCNPNE